VLRQQPCRVSSILARQGRSRPTKLIDNVTQPDRIIVVDLYGTLDLVRISFADRRPRGLVDIAPAQQLRPDFHCCHLYVP
jgi:hypothetical protein